MVSAQTPKESISGYFRKLFGENPKLLKVRDNTEALSRWLSDHPTYNSVPTQVKNAIANIKSVMRKRRKSGRTIPMAPDGSFQLTPKSAVRLMLPGQAEPLKRRDTKALETLEEQIDDTLASARGLPGGLPEVIDLLRRARNRVILAGHTSHAE